MAKKLKAMTFPATVSILGTPWRIEVRDRMKDKDLKDSHADGYSSFPERLIVIADLSIDPIFAEDEQGFVDELMKRCLRHEIVHAFLDESGLLAFLVLGRKMKKWLIGYLFKARKLQKLGMNVVFLNHFKHAQKTHA